MPINKSQRIQRKISPMFCNFLAVKFSLVDYKYLTNRTRDNAPDKYVYSPMRLVATMLFGELVLLYKQLR